MLTGGGPESREPAVASRSHRLREADRDGAAPESAGDVTTPERPRDGCRGASWVERENDGFRGALVR